MKNINNIFENKGHKLFCKIYIDPFINTNGMILITQIHEYTFKLESVKIISLQYKNEL